MYKNLLQISVQNVQVIFVLTFCLTRSMATFKEYCQNEVFEASCYDSHSSSGDDASSASHINPSADLNEPPGGSEDDRNHRSAVVVMTESHYGLMKIGKCVRKDYGYIGCGSDVLGITDQLCSGRRNCSVRIPNKRFDAAAARRCPEDFKNYLNATYHCVDVVTATRLTCFHDRVLTQLEGVIASVTSLETGCGLAQAPWQIILKPGQRIALKLYNFAHAQRDHVTMMTSRATIGSKMTSTALYKSIVDGRHGTLVRLDGSSPVLGGGASACPYALATIKEPSRRSFTICDVDARVTENIYVSTRETLQIFITAQRDDVQNARYFLLKYTALGCTTPLAPAGGWVRRVGESLSIGCNESSTALWALICTGHSWTGLLQQTINCSSPDDVSSQVGGQFGTQSLTVGTGVAAVVVVALLTAFIILSVGAVFITKRRNTFHATFSDKHRPCANPQPLGNATSSESCDQVEQPTDRSVSVEYGVDTDTTHQDISSSSLYASNYHHGRVGQTSLDPSSDIYRDLSDYAYIESASSLVSNQHPPSQMLEFIYPITGCDEQIIYPGVGNYYYVGGTAIPCNSSWGSELHNLNAALTWSASRSAAAVRTSELIHHGNHQVAMS